MQPTRGAATTTTVETACRFCCNCQVYPPVWLPVWYPKLTKPMCKRIQICSFCEQQRSQESISWWSLSLCSSPHRRNRTGYVHNTQETGFLGYFSQLKIPKDFSWLGWTRPGTSEKFVDIQTQPRSHWIVLWCCSFSRRFQQQSYCLAVYSSLQATLVEKQHWRRSRQLSIKRSNSDSSCLDDTCNFNDQCQHFKCCTYKEIWSYRKKAHPKVSRLQWFTKFDQFYWIQESCYFLHSWICCQDVYQENSLKSPLWSPWITDSSSKLQFP